MGKSLKKFLKLLKLDESRVSVILGALVVVVIGVLIFNYFNRLNRGQIEQSPVEEVKPTEEETTTTPSTIEGKPGLPTNYTVVAGDTLWKIAEKYYKSGYEWVKIAQANNLTNPDLLFAGTILTLPKVEIKKGDINGPGAKTEGPLAITSATYTVVKGDYLWNIAVRACGDGYKWVRLAEVNKLENSDIIHSGNVLKISCK